MKKHFFKTLLIVAVTFVTMGSYAQAPISPVPAGGANAYPGGTPTQSPNGIATPGYNNNAGSNNVASPPAPIGNGYVGPSGSSNPASVPGSAATGPTTPVNPSAIPQNPGRNDVYSPGSTPQ